MMHGQINIKLDMTKLAFTFRDFANTPGNS